MSINNLAIACILATLSIVPVALAQDEAQEEAAPAALPSWVEEDPFTSEDDDPLGMDRGDHLEQVAPTTVEEEVHRPIPVQHGEVLSAIAGVREAAHDVTVRLANGLAQVDVTMRFESSARHAAELRYRLAVPPGASLAALEVCNQSGCRTGSTDRSGGMLGAYDDAVRSHAGSGAPAPVGHAAPVRDERGEAIWVRAAPITPAAREVRRDRATGRAAGTLEVRLRYVVPAPVRGGRARVELPERGRDDRAAPASIRVRSDELSSGAVGAVDAVERAVERAAWEPAEVSARLTDAAPSVDAQLWTVACGRGRCGRIRLVAAPRRMRPRDVILLLDASPSTAGPARGRLAPAVAALLSSLPSRARVRVAVFAARSEAVIEERTAPTDVPLVQITRALERDLGSATRFEAAWSTVAPWVRDAEDPLVLLIGDGGLTTSEEATAAFEAARAAGAEVASLNVADRGTTAGLRRALGEGAWVDAGPEADRAGRGHGMDALEERLAALLAPVVEERIRARIGRRGVDLGPLRAGEELVWEGPLERGAVSLSAGSPRSGSARRGAVEPPEAIAVAVADRLARIADVDARPIRLAALAEGASDAASCTTQGPFRSTSAAAPRGARLVLADSRRCDRPSVPEPIDDTEPTRDMDERMLTLLRRQDGPAGLPEQTLLSMLRQRIVPVARGCFRDDRAGRGDYQTRAVFSFRIADREVIDATIEGRIRGSLRRCLARAIDDLEIPRFDGVVNVRYPIYTAPRLPPPTLSLDPEVADAVDAVVDDAE